MIEAEENRRDAGVSYLRGLHDVIKTLEPRGPLEHVIYGHGRVPLELVKTRPHCSPTHQHAIVSPV